MVQTQIANNRYCEIMNREVQIEETYRLEGSGTCQIDIQLISWRCLTGTVCPAPEGCPLHREYALTGEKSFLDR